MKKLATLVVGFGVCSMVAFGQTYKMKQDVVASGASDASNSTMRARSTVGQAIIGLTLNTTNADGQGFWHAVAPSIISGVEISKTPGMPSDYELFQNFPNPFNPTTTIKFSVPSRSHVALKVFSMTGSLVKTLIDENYAAGEYSVVFSANEFPTGSYLYTLEAGGHLMTKRMILIK